jgi:hypothetical protein
MLIEQARQACCARSLGADNEGFGRKGHQVFLPDMIAPSMRELYVARGHEQIDRQ